MGNKRIRINTRQHTMINEHVVRENNEWNTRWNEFMDKEKITPDELSTICQVVGQAVGNDLSKDAVFGNAAVNRHKLVLPTRLVEPLYYEGIPPLKQALADNGFEGHYDEDRRQMTIYRAGYFKRKDSEVGEPR